MTARSATSGPSKALGLALGLCGLAAFIGALGVATTPDLGAPGDTPSAELVAALACLALALGMGAWLIWNHRRGWRVAARVAAASGIIAGAVGIYLSVINVAYGVASVGDWLFAGVCLVGGVTGALAARAAWIAPD
jgi:hypothetical protein